MVDPEVISGQSRDLFNYEENVSNFSKTPGPQNCSENNCKSKHINLGHIGLKCTLHEYNNKF